MAKYKNPLTGEWETLSVALAYAGGTSEPEKVLSDNLFDKTTALDKKIFYHGSQTAVLTENEVSFAAYVELRGAGTYRTIVAWNFHSEELIKRVPLFKEDKTFSQYATGTLTKIDSTFGYLEFTVTNEYIENGAFYYGFDGSNLSSSTYNINNVMIVKDRDYPNKYIPYGYITVNPGTSVGGVENILYDKTAVFLGDSICAGTTTLASAPEYGYGWGGLIGEKNKMAWRNFGKNGGTVTLIPEVGEGLWLMTQVEAIKSVYPNPDYIIFDGGANDADRMKETGKGEISSDFKTFDTTKFSGAFEALILKLLTDFPKAKIGYVTTPKMGGWNDDFNSRNYVPYFERAKEICKKWGVPYIDLWNETPLNPRLITHYDSSLSADEANIAEKFYTDGQHLTLAGYKMLQNPIEEFMRRL